MIAGIKFVQQDVVVINDLGGGQQVRVSGRMRVSHERHIIPERHRPAACRVDTIFGHAADDHQVFCFCAGQFGLQFRLVESVARPLVYDNIICGRGDFRVEWPAWCARFKPVAGAAIVLNKYDRDSALSGFVDKHVDRADHFSAAISRQAFDQTDLNIDNDKSDSFFHIVILMFNHAFGKRLTPHITGRANGNREALRISLRALVDSVVRRGLA